jgi:hypothetical protein
MKFKRLLITPERVFELFTAGIHSPSAYVIDQAAAIPSDARLVNVRHAWPSEIELLIESESFEEVKQGDVIPELNVVVTRLHSAVTA